MHSIDGLDEYVLKRFPHGTRVHRTSLSVITGYLAKPEAGLPEERRERVAKVHNAANRFEKLANLRNRTILAHGFEGVSQKKLEAEYGSNALIKDLRESVGKALGRDLSNNPFFDLAKELKF